MSKFLQVSRKPFFLNKIEFSFSSPLYVSGGVESENQGLKFELSLEVFEKSKKHVNLHVFSGFSALALTYEVGQK